MCVAPLARCLLPYTCKSKKILTWLLCCYVTVLRNLMLNKNCLFIQDLNYIWAIHIFLHFFKHLIKITLWIVQHTQFLLTVLVFTVVYWGFCSAWMWHCMGCLPLLWRNILPPYSRANATHFFETLATTYPVMPYHISGDWTPALYSAVRVQGWPWCVMDPVAVKHNKYIHQ